jgi:AcrR family transcriptional regulator
MTTATLSRRDRERRERRRAMLDAALVVFAEKGYDGATLDEIAERAEFGKGTLYNYFPEGKEAILFALIDEVFEGMTTLIRDHFAEAEALPIREAFRGLIGRLLHHFTVNQETFFLLIKEAQRLMLTAHEQVAALHHHRDRSIDALVGPIERAMEAGEIRPLPPHAVAHTLLGNVKGYLMYACPRPGCEADDAFGSLDDATDFITTMLFDGLLPRD